MVKEYDTNLIISDKIGERDVAFYAPNTDPFRLYGAFYDGETYCRMPKEIAQDVSKGIGARYASLSGGRIRFVTDSSFVAVKIHYAELLHNDVTPSSGSMAFNMYVDGEFGGVFRLPDGFDGEDFSSLQALKTPGEHVITIYMPIHSFVDEFYIGVSPDAKIKRAPDYTYETPIVYYGSSITQGTGASRAGMTYPAQISRMIDTNFVNLGFGGLAKGEIPMAKYISTLDMSVFVYDYDFNATTSQLDETHEPFFKAFREKQPTTPVVMISRPSSFRSGDEDTATRLAIIKRTYDNAVASGDKNVYLINGLEFFAELKWECMVDGVHPSDFGYYFIAKKLAPVLKELL